MAVRYDAAADRLLRTSDLINYNAVYTVMGWIYLVSDLNAAGRFWSLNTNSTTNDFDFVGVNTDGTTLIARTAVGAATTTGSGSNLSIATWYHVALVRSATNMLDVYLNGTLDSNHTRSTSGRTAVTRMEAGAWTTGNANRSDARMAAMKAYSTNLTAAEIAAEMLSYAPIRTSNLYEWWPLLPGANRPNGFSANVRHWTEGGTLTDEDGPPIPFLPPDGGVGVFDTLRHTAQASDAAVHTITPASTTVHSIAVYDTDNA